MRSSYFLLKKNFFSDFQIFNQKYHQNYQIPSEILLKKNFLSDFLIILSEISSELSDSIRNSVKKTFIRFSDYFIRNVIRLIRKYQKFC
ncbi:hypothetical protein HanIR_Chr13g0659781 [Helianthus annuus]|nr:hypothetical protein HanIR_Chr13g0659781 [Helianthus annuus]